MRRRLAWAGAGLLLVGVAGAALWLAASAWPASGARPLAGLRAPVTLYRDAHGVPHLFAAGEEDATAALGFAHAEDRLWQMEAMRRLGAGRLAELLGPAALPSDRWMRTLGLYRLAEQQYPLLGERTRRLLDAYAQGVNAWLADPPRPLPPEFLLLGHRPEPWRPADSLVWLKLMALRLSVDRRDELLRMRLAERLSPEQLADLWPDEPAGSPVTLAATAADAARAAGLPDRNAGPAPLTRNDARPQTSSAGELRTDAPATRAPPSPRSAFAGILAGAAGGLGWSPWTPQPGASNAWVVAGERTATGKPVLANDPHLSFTLPQPWYLARIETKDGALAGATAPGFPALILGHNGRVAWGITSSDIDVEDVFVERVDPGDPALYAAPDGWRAFAVRWESIAVRDAEPVALRVRESRHGPVISDLPGLPQPPAARFGEEEAPKVLALSATYLLPDDRTADAVFALSLARDVRDVLAAARLATAPQQNVLFADIAGGIGFVSAGRVPVRAADAPRLPVPGWTGTDDWQGFVPFEGLPQALSAPHGWLVNANNRPAPPGWPWPISGAWDAGFRAERAVQLLAQGAARSIEGSAAAQVDTLSLMARRLLPLMLGSLPSAADHASAAGLLAGWDGRVEQHRPEPLIFFAWLRELVRALFEDDLGDAFAAYWDYRPRAVERALSGRGGWCDDRRTAAAVEDCPSRLSASLRSALVDLGRRYGDDPRRWRWGDAHLVLFENPLWKRVPLVGGIASYAPRADGGNDTLLRAASVIADEQRPFAAVHGGGFRGVYDLADLARSRFVLATGQSGNPLSRHYRDMTALWLRGEALRLDAGRQSLEDGAASRLRLQPASGHR